MMALWSSALLLVLWPAWGNAAGSAADYYVRNLPGLPDGVPPVKMHAGHIEVTPEHNGNLFFWHFENQHIANRQRTVIWLNGGPGCSSEDGALMEIGPYRVQDKDTLSLNNGSWNEFANLLFVDNPVGTGFSYVDTNNYVHELDEMAEQFVLFLEKFFDLFPHYEQDDIYIAGESYAGQHIPYVAKAILDRNKKRADGIWNLKGLLIGNGWIAPRQQYEAYLNFALEKGLVEKDSDTHREIQGLVKVCRKTLSNDPGHVDYKDCEDILAKMLRHLMKGNGDDACINMYDVRLRDSYPSCGMNWPPDLKNVEPYLRRSDVTDALHVNPQRNTGWQECNGAVGSAFSARDSKPSVELLPDIVAEVPTLLFSGAEDLICNHLGTEDILSSLEWNGAKGFEITPGNWAPRRDWTFEGEAAGFWQEARNLTYVLFYNASHMVPFDYPQRSRDMLDRFMGVDISSIGGIPFESRIDGEKGLDTTVGGVNNTDTDGETQKQVDEAKWEAYRRSGEIVLVIVVIAAAGWGYFIWRERRKRAQYHVVNAQEPMTGRAGLSAMRRKPQTDGDLEAAAFDENELDDLHVESPTVDKYSVGDDSDDDDDKKANPKTQAGSSSR